MFDEPGWHLIVGAEGDGERLDHLIARRVPRLSRARASRLKVTLLNERDELTSRVLKKSSRMREGQRIWVSRPLPPESLEGLDHPQVISMDHELLALSKPAGWVAHPTASRYLTALTTWLTREGIDATPAHRLDLETSGVVLCARSLEVDIELKRAFAEREVHKRYLAICEVSPRGRAHLAHQGDYWRDETPLGFDPQSEVRLKMGLGDLEARTDFRVLESSIARDRVLIEARPLTGRQHQIRAHLSIAGLPIVGDKLYGPDEQLFLRHLEGELDAHDIEVLGHERQALHAATLSLSWRGESRAWSSPLPDELYALLSR